MVREHIQKISKRMEDTHKGDYGKVFVIAGSRGMTGAAFLVSQGALLAGSGLVINGIPESLNTVMEVKLTEAMTLPLAETAEGTLSLEAAKGILEFSRKCDVVVIGPGLGKSAEVYRLVKDLLTALEKPVILDADGLNAIAGETDILNKRPARTIITPHPGEMARLIGKEVKDVQSNREDTARSVSEITGAVVCLKGHRSVVANPAGKIYINETGNSGMATGGTGDILTGMIASFVGQGIDDFSASVSAVYLHGLAGDIAAEKKGQFSMIASDVLACLADAFARAGI